MAKTNLPLVSIITPSYNQGKFIQETIESVLTQDYSNIEYIIVDGASNDETLTILKKYSELDPRFRFVSEPDNGQAHAVNKGVKMANGEIIGWLNSDDTYLPGAIRKAVSAFNENENWAVVYGLGNQVNAKSQFINKYPVSKVNSIENLFNACVICQPATFFRKAAFRSVGGLDESLDFAMDYDLWIRLAKKYPFRLIEEYLANARIHPEAKTSVRILDLGFPEIIKIGNKHFGKVSNYFLSQLLFLSKQRKIDPFWILKLFQKYNVIGGTPKIKRFKNSPNSWILLSEQENQFLQELNKGAYSAVQWLYKNRKTNPPSKPFIIHEPNKNMVRRRKWAAFHRRNVLNRARIRTPFRITKVPNQKKFPPFFQGKKIPARRRIQPSLPRKVILNKGKIPPHLPKKNKLYRKQNLVSMLRRNRQKQRWNSSFFPRRNIPKQKQIPSVFLRKRKLLNQKRKSSFSKRKKTVNWIRMPKPFSNWTRNNNNPITGRKIVQRRNNALFVSKRKWRNPPGRYYPKSTNMTRIGINLIDLWPGKIGGLEQYVKSLIEYTSRLNKYEIYVFLNQQIVNEFRMKNQNIKKIGIDVNKGPKALDNQFYKWINQLKINLWFCPLFRFQPQSVNIPSVVLLPDIQHVFFPEFFTPEILSWRNHNIWNAAQRANVIMTISDFSRQTIIQNYQVLNEKIVTIYGDSPEEFTLIHDQKTKEEIKRKYGLPQNYCLYPANTWPHKNHLSLLQALVILRDQYNKKMNVVFTGHTGAHMENLKQIQNFITKNHLWEQVTFLDYIPQGEMPYLYMNSQFLVYPSLFEGFGIPLIEAMRTGTPIICSNAGSITEIVGDSALIFDPRNPEDIAQKMTEILNKETRNLLIEKGKQQATKFSWGKSAEKAAEIFDMLVHKK